MNKVPKPWYEKEIYCQLIPNDDDNNPYYDILPRIGAFEVSTVIHNTDILFYSKMMTSMWPHGGSLADRIGQFIEDAKVMGASALKNKYQTTGRQTKQPRARTNRSALSTAGTVMGRSRASM